MTIIEQINAVVEAREKAREANCQRVAEYNKWLEANQLLFDTETDTKVACNEAEGKLREMAVAQYAETREKAVAPGVGIRVLTKLGYDNQAALGWAIEHKLALKLDTPTFEKIAKTSNLPFVNISEEPQATIATELAKLEGLNAD